MERAIASEVNKLRDNPKKYAEGMQMLMECYDERSVLSYPSGAKIQTAEGVGALQDCLNDLMASPQLPTLMTSEAISGVVRQHICDLRDNDLCSHIGTDGSTPEARLARVGEHREQCGENVVFGLTTAKEMVWHMLLDDGAPERGHRANLLNPDFRFVGTAYGEHPTGRTVTAIMLADHFTMKPVSKHDHLRHVAEGALGVSTQDAEGEAVKGRAAHKAWDTLAQQTKPDHLKVPSGLLKRVQEMHRPALYKEKLFKVERHATGVLNPRPSVDPAVVRAFVHRIDADHDDLFDEHEIQAICHMHQLIISPELVAKMFDEILNRRQLAARTVRTLDWKELYAAMRPLKEWVPAADVHIQVEGEGSSYQLTLEGAALEKWCEEVYAEFEGKCDLPPPPKFVHVGVVEDPSKPVRTKLPRNRGAAARVQELNAFLAAVLSATNAASQSPLQLEDQVQKLLGRPGAPYAEGAPLLASATCLSLRRLWAYQVRPYRDLWLRLIKAVGLDPLVPLPDALVQQSLGDHLQAEVHIVEEKNVARMAKKPGSAKMLVRDPPESVHVRHESSPVGSRPGSRPASRPPSGGSRASRASRGATAAARTETAELLDATAKPAGPAAAKPAAATAKAATMPQPHWEERRMQTETVVNTCIRPGVGEGLGASQTGMVQGSAPEMAYTFEARRKFGQVLAKQQRASDERRFLSTEQLGGNRLRGSRGTGAHSLSAPGGMRGHFHNTAFHPEADGSFGWPGSVHMDAQLNGEHVDHTLAPEMRPNAKLSKMDQEERGRQFSCYFKEARKSINERKLEVASDQKTDLTKWEPFSHDFRTDVPQRHGKFGRRAFDPQVREKPVSNRYGISEIENKPVEEFMHAQERVHEFLERSLPPGQAAHFQTSQPPAQQPDRMEDLSSRNKVLSIMGDGGLKRPEHGYFQSRHSDQRDMKVYTRPIGTCHLDRQVPLA